MLKTPPLYSTEVGAAYLGDSRELLRELPDASVNLVVTSPPFALHFKKEYGNVEKHEYVPWFLDFAREVRRVLHDDGSFVIDIGGSWEAGRPTRSLYQFKLLIALVEEVGLHLAQEFFWFNPGKMPAPAEWVTVRRIRVKDSVNYVWWLSKTPSPKADNRKVLVPYSPDMERLIKRGYKAKQRPSGHNVTAKWGRDLGGAICSNLFTCGNNDSNGIYLKRCEEAGIKPHPARFPSQLPEFFINFLTDPGDVVLDIFAGSNTAGAVAERLQRKWLAFESSKDYLAASRFRFEDLTDGGEETDGEQRKAKAKQLGLAFG
ncbi:MAG: site-specific DNA-methyltransferase [Myxococcota bacterium]